ncbi:MAG: hypothetical protein A2Z42_00545 [Candidatus Woykebacteria bacterium RBG_19FT_COMBO_43_10]|uniref:histidine kinase n=1 Tax=Candidatus Woykebacteria bacterium RBG_19FT_COMBO_43_10 TaxID=1802598 RepID=A0A1G1WL19_9BACT|nr:MAG: hypothetical protein A2Z42_00545 [Candidatus Woykebacteria bacterium RBG_19FT_COMBO_43_10]
MNELPKEGILSSFLITGQFESKEKYKRFERLSEIFTLLAVILGVLIIQLPFGENLNRQVIYILAISIGIFALIWYHLLPKSFSGRAKRLAYNLITISFIGVLVHNTNGVQGYSIFFYFLALLSVSMTLPLTYTALTAVYAIGWIVIEGFLTAGSLATNLSLAVLHSWGLVLVVFFARFNAGEASLVKKHEEDVTLEKEKSVGRLKDEFVYIISHELKQPAIAIKSYLDDIFTRYPGKLNSESREILNLTRVNSGRLGKLLDDLLDISQIEKGRLHIKMVDVALRPIISEVLSTLLLDAHSKRISLVQQGAEEVAAKADVDRLKEVLTNLVSNSIRYTPEGGKVVVELRKEGGFAKILVTDNGIGISDEDQTHLFEKFYRVDNEQTRVVKGSGLGLFITKQLVEKMGGQVSVTSKKEAGTTFYFTLPRYRW